MAKTATSNLVRLRYIPEEEFGTTPSVGSSLDLRFTGESLNYNISTETSNEIRADRNVADVIPVDVETNGDVEFELSFGTFDEFIAAALGGTWEPVDDPEEGFVLKNGVDVPFFSIEKGFTDIDQFLLYTGMAVNTMSLEFAVGSMISGSFGFLGSQAFRSGSTQVPAAGTPLEYTSVMNPATNFADLVIDGTPYPCGVSSISLNTEAGLRDQKALGKLGACTILAGQFNPTGSFTMYMADGNMFDKYINNTPFSLTWTVRDDAGNEYVFTLPKVKITEANPTAGGLDTDVELDVSFQAIYDPVSECSIEIFKSA